MTFIKLATATLMTTLLATSAIAQAVPFSEIDTDTDGVLSYEELVTTFGEDGAATVLGTADTDADDSLTEDELRGGGDTRREEREANRPDRDDTDDSANDNGDDDSASEDRPRPPRDGGRPGPRGPRGGENTSDTDTTTE
jgi:hypothetical protein